MIVLPRLSLVIPCYNEALVLPSTAPQFMKALEKLIGCDKIAADSEILFVDDGSKDETWPIIETIARSNPLCTGISLSRNRGHQNALYAGMMTARMRCDVCITIDCDGQDDIDSIEAMIDAYRNGFDVVYGVRSDRSSDSAFKRMTAETFYRLLNFLGADCVFNHADYRLLSKRALDELSKFKETNLFLRGLVPLIGFDSTTVAYKRLDRTAGASHYSLGKMLKLAVDGITSLSIKPIRIIETFGLAASLLSFIGVLWAIGNALAGNTVSGWASLTSVVCFMGGIQLLSLGIIGEYVGKTYLETKQRPRYAIARTCGLRSNADAGRCTADAKRANNPCSQGQSTRENHDANEI